MRPSESRARRAGFAKAWIRKDVLGAPLATFLILFWFEFMERDVSTTRAVHRKLQNLYTLLKRCVRCRLDDVRLGQNIKALKSA